MNRRPGRSRLSVFAAAAIAGLLLVTSGAAQAAEVELLSDHSTLAPGATFKVAILPELRPGETLSFWAGGDSGAHITWTLPEGFTLGRSNWPPVDRVEVGGGGLRFQFRQDIPIVQEITAPEDLDTDGPLTLRLRLEARVCAATCRSESFAGRTTIEIGAAEPSPSADAVNEHYRATLVFRKRHVAFRSSEGVLSLALTLDGFAEDDRLVDVDPVRIASAIFLPLQAGILAGPEPLPLSRNQQGVFGQAPLAASYDPGQMIEGIFAALDSNGQPIYVRHIAEPSEQARAALFADIEIVETGMGAGISFTIVTAILFALLGGLILNIMPCVFPVLALKAFALMKSGGASEQTVRREGLAYTIGIVVSFLIVGLVITGLRSAGDLVGWGFQLQQPAFVLIMILVLFAVGLNFLGVFEISGRLAGMGQSLAEKEGTAGAFSTGVLAALVATPCTAPFMAPAIAYALAAGTASGLAIFFALGVGLALPFLLISFVPPLRRLLPKPGPWMQKVKEFLAFPIFATVIWLVWVFESETGATGLLVSLGAVLLLSLAAWLADRGAKGSLKRLAAAALVVMAIAPVGLTGRLPRPVMHAPGETMWVGGMEVEIYGPDRLEAMQARISDLRGEGRSVFLHFWATWCIICLTHENLVYSTAEYQEYLAANDVVFLMANNTLMDPRTAAMMQIFGADGQPLDVFFPARGGNKAVVLPKIFTTGNVIDQMKRALAGS
jgi:thiol:disulfide interchange protein DsbD